MMKKHLIMEKALELFAKQGFEATSVQQITEHCGISKGAFYLSFKSKNELILDLLDYFLRKILSDIDYLVKNTKNAALLYEFYETLFHSFQKHHDFAKLLLKEQILTINDTFMNKMYAYEVSFEKMILTLLERNYGETIKNSKYDLIYCVKGLINTYSQLLLFGDAPFDVKLLIQSLVEKTNILAKYTTIPFISQELLQTLKRPTNENITKEQLLEMMEEKIGTITVSRTENESLKELAAANDVFHRHFSCNLASADEIEEVFQEILALLESAKPETVYVINNAGVIEPIATVGALDLQAMIQNVAVNLTAPMMITNILLHKASAKLRIANVSSGAAERPIQGWSTYCSTKAGLNMFTQTAAAEQKSAGSPHEIIAFSPGIMDTDMQSTIRSADKDAFQDLEKFKEYKEKGMLRPAATVGNALADLLLREEIENGKVYHVNELIK